MKKFFAVAAALATLCVGAVAQEYKMVGKMPAPQFQLRGLDGKSINTADLRGKVVVYNLWFVGCPPCREEIPKLNAIVDEYAGKDAVFIGLSSSNAKDVENFVKDVPFKYQLVPNSAALMLGGFGDPAGDGTMKLGFPLHVVVNRDGFIEVKVQGMKGVDAVRESLRKQFAESPAQN